MKTDDLLEKVLEAKEGGYDDVYFSLSYKENREPMDLDIIDRCWSSGLGGRNVTFILDECEE